MLAIDEDGRKRIAGAVGRFAAATSAADGMRKTGTRFVPGCELGALEFVSPMELESQKRLLRHLAEPVQSLTTCTASTAYAIGAPPFQQFALVLSLERLQAFKA